MTPTVPPVDAGYTWLDDCAANSYSQSGEDGVLEAIFRIIGPANKWCCECGAADGLFFSNTRRFIEQGWNAILIEGNSAEFGHLAENNRQFGSRVKLQRAFVGQECRMEDVLHAAKAPTDLDLMVIDVDGQDYYIWNSMLHFQPRVVVIEYNERAPCPEYCPAIGAEGQAGPLAILKLATGKFYTHVWTSRFNMVFVAYPISRLLLGKRREPESKPEPKPEHDLDAAAERELTPNAAQPGDGK
jgi:hypothetical protein